jgi:hypothetical protein
MRLITIGRHPSNEQIVDDKYVGRNHLQIIQNDAGNFTLFDLGSKNGTFINGNKIPCNAEIPLKSTDIIRIGSTVLPWKTYFEGEEPEKPPKPDPKPDPKPNPKPDPKPFPWRTIASVITTIVGLLLAMGSLYVMLSKL